MLLEGERGAISVKGTQIGPANDGVNVAFREQLLAQDVERFGRSRVAISRGGRPEIELSVYLGWRLLRAIPASQPL